MKSLCDIYPLIQSVFFIFLLSYSYMKSLPFLFIELIIAWESVIVFKCGHMVATIFYAK